MMPKIKYPNGTGYEEVDYSANKVQLEDTGNLFTATDVEGALAEVKDDVARHKADNAINVMHPPNGLTACVGDGLTDDTIAIQGVIDYVAAMGGGSVYIPRGKYKHSGIVVKDKINLYGDGKATELINDTDSSSIIIGDATSYVFDTSISRLCITGNRANVNAHGIEYIGQNPAYSIVEGVHIKNVGGHGIVGGHDGHVNNIEIKGCFITGCGGDGINMQYGLGQVNAIWIHHNNIVANRRNGILFFGNNVVVESNTIQYNAKFGISLSDIDSLGIKYCFGSVIKSNYFERNYESIDSEASIIGIFIGRAETESNNRRMVKGLSIENNFFGESGLRYKSIIYCHDRYDSLPTLENCILSTKNNYGNLPILSFNKSGILSEGCVVDETDKNLIPTTLLSSLPRYVEVRGVNNIEIGGRNFIVGSSFYPLFEYTEKHNSVTEIVEIESPYGDIRKALKITPSVVSSNYVRFNVGIPTLGNFTFSYWAKCDDGTVDIQTNINGTNTKLTELSSGWIKVIQRNINIDYPTSSSGFVSFRNYADLSPYYIFEPQLEKGKIASDWKPSYLDFIDAQ